MKSKSQPPAATAESLREYEEYKARVERVRNAKALVRDAEARVQRVRAELEIDEAKHRQQRSPFEVAAREYGGDRGENYVQQQFYQDPNQGRRLDDRDEATLRANRRFYEQIDRARAAKHDAAARTEYATSAAAVVIAADGLPYSKRELALPKALAAVRAALAFVTPDDADGICLRAVLAAYEPESKATVENRKNTTYNPPVEHPPDIGGAPAEEWVTARVEKRRWEAVKKEVADGDASPAARALVEAGMVAHGRELTGRDAAPVAEPATQEAKTEAQAFAAALEIMTLKERRAALAAHYGVLDEKTGRYAIPEENKWATVRSENPTPEQFRAWLDDVFPDRRKIGLVLSDLKHLDEPAYKKIFNWSRPDSGVSKETIEWFDLPTRIIKYNAARDADAPKSWPEVHERAKRGEDSVKNLTRAFQRVQPHLR